MNKQLIKLTCSLVLLGATASAQSTLDLNVSLVNGNDALVTWIMGGDWTTTGAISQGNGFNIISISTTGMFNSRTMLNYTLSDAGTLTDTATSSSSAFNYFGMSHTTMFGSTSEGIGFNISPILNSSAGDVIQYTPGTVNSVEFANAFSSFNAGTYTGSDPYLFTTPVNVTVTVEPSPTPEPSTLALSVMGGLGSLLLFRRRE